MMVLALGGMMVVGQTSAFAGFGDLVGGGKKSADSGGATIDKDAFGKSANELAGNVLAARISFLDAKAKMMEALGLKTDSVTKASEALQATKGASDAGKQVDAINNSKKTTEEADKQYEAALADSKELSAESKTKFAEGGGKFIEGVLLEKAQIEAIQKLVAQGQSLVQSASPLQKVGVLSIVKPVTTMSSMVPGDVKEGTSTLSKILKFCQSQNVPLPKDATDKLGGLGL